MKICVLILAFGLIAASCLAADQAQTQAQIRKTIPRNTLPARYYSSPPSMRKSPLFWSKEKEWKYYQFSQRQTAGS